MEETIDLLITVPFPENLIAQIQDVSPRLRVRAVKASKADEIPPDYWATPEILYTSRVLPTPEQAPNLDWIQFHYAGVDHTREAPILRKAGLTATTMSGASASQVAEYVLMMLLALGHKLPELMEHQRKVGWPKDRWERFSPLELRDRTVGIVGYGSIGRQVARLLHPFGAQVLATKRNAMQPDDTGYTLENQGDPAGDFVRRLYPSEALKSMARECDFLVVTVPLTTRTRGMVGAEVFDVMKPGAFLVDTSRGGVVDHAALISALRDHKIAGAALDVFPEEPLSDNSPLWKMSNVIVTPHISGNSPQYDQRAIRLFIQNLRRYLAGQPLLNQMDLNEGY